MAPESHHATIDRLKASRRRRHCRYCSNIMKLWSRVDRRPIITPSIKHSSARMSSASAPWLSKLIHFTFFQQQWFYLHWRPKGRIADRDYVNTVEKQFIVKLHTIQKKMKQNVNRPKTTAGLSIELNINIGVDTIEAVGYKILVFLYVSLGEDTKLWTVV